MDLSAYAQCAGASPPAVPASPSIGYPSGGDPATGTPATTPGPYWFFQLQSEIAAVLAAAGLEPSTTTLTQLRQAIVALSSGGLSFETLVASLQMDGAASVGDRDTVVRGNHRHPTDTSRAPLVSPNFTAGTPLVPTQTAGTNNTTAASTAFVAAAIAAAGSGSAVAAGTIIAFAGANPPSGYLLCNGAAAPRTAYAALFSALGTTYGIGDGTSTFNVPDYRGLFLRGLDLMAGIDSGRLLGSLQKGSLIAFDLGTTAAQTCGVNLSDGVAAQAVVGLDNYATGDYSGATIRSVGGAAVGALPGLFAGRWTGVARPANRSVYFYVKY